MVFPIFLLVRLPRMAQRIWLIPSHLFNCSFPMLLTCLFVFGMILIFAQYAHTIKQLQQVSRRSPREERLRAVLDRWLCKIQYLNRVNLAIISNEQSMPMKIDQSVTLEGGALQCNWRKQWVAQPKGGRAMGTTSFWIGFSSG